ncbi:phospholipase C, phosphocholine-specific [Novosphingobium sp. KCTC 2891]|uniref:phosphocholine-specific phospholipase C n=1 Tax=Novosphingobium sp. KCTC 2891 TaxID=2989730 RepID=UPI0022232ECD|nr:phospholipase C, phosphocholine-specific [Novosphingobium sp. KCTC 2891]MCW1383694.1 phospholipase C, phosphocholine-specific [Novosphingobium sp. KCTC 2891]
MIDGNRRSFLRGSLAATAAAGFPAAIARAASIAPDVRSGTIADIDHVVILMQENRSFDHYFGTMAGVNGFSDRFAIPLPLVDGAPRDVWRQKAKDGRLIAPFHLATTVDFELMRVEGTPHHWEDAQFAWDNGRMDSWPAAKTPRAMGHFQREDIPFQFALAEAFTLCDAYHCSIQAGTNPNRLFLWTGTNGPSGTTGGPAISNSHDNLPQLGGHPESYRWTTYAERLHAAGIDWRIYQDMADNFTDNPLAGFHAFRTAFDRAPGSNPELLERGLSTHTLDRFRADVREGKLPQVSYMIAPAALSEHPGPSSPAQGAAYTAEVLEALTANPAVWARTVLFVMYDENDGFFDHVPPPAPPARADGGLLGGSTVSTDGEYHLAPSPAAKEADIPELRGRSYGLGPRVPMFVVSPWSRGGWINSQVFDHTSVIRFLEQRLGIAEPNITPWRRAVCGDLTTCLDFSRQDARMLSALPDPRPQAARAAKIAHQPSPDAPAIADRAAQEWAIRPSRSLPYRLDVTGSAGEDAIALHFHAGEHDGHGTGAVFHVYDRLALDRAPRRYTVTPGQSLTGDWPFHDGAYDLWVLGPNGFHRHFAGNAGEVAPRLDWRLDHAARTLSLSLSSGRLEVMPAAYGTHYRGWAAEGRRQHRWQLDATGGWYDFVLTSPEAPAFRRRLAGRLENGRPTITDPARGWV